MNCLSANSSAESTKSRKLLRFSPKLRKRKSEKGVHGVAMATSNDAHVPNGLNDRERLAKNIPARWRPALIVTGRSIIDVSFLAAQRPSRPGFILQASGLKYRPLFEETLAVNYNTESGVAPSIYVLGEKGGSQAMPDGVSVMDSEPGGEKLVTVLLFEFPVWLIAEPDVSYRTAELPDRSAGDTNFVRTTSGNGHSLDLPRATITDLAVTSHVLWSLCPAGQNNDCGWSEVSSRTML
ncbi:hypothetical protein RRG08_060026 [Elysia crispata]|uniref:Uncharacterized protein n=1 Tax=Elysia crispata TaxID=231223 RepID=A0AAE0YFN7_9GAST|nr:hypothetical protein RRG08_060026 [Elysia crispata]